MFQHQNVKQLHTHQLNS